MLYEGHVFTNKAGEKFRRVNKTEARNRANKGEAVGVCACNMDPFPYYDCWNYMSWYHPAEELEAVDGFDTFDKFVNAYEFYNCSRETGYYASYYIEL